MKRIAPSAGRRRGAVLAALVLTVPVGVFASVPAPPRIEERTEVVAVEVPVNVVDRDGQAVRGLRAEDFQVFDEGKPQPLTGFEVIDLATLAPHGPAPAPAAAAPAAAGERLPPALRRHLLLLFDLSYSSPISILKARLAARDFVLHDLQPSDLAAIATVSLEHGFQLVVTFTPDRAQLARGIDTLGLKQRSDAFARNDPLQFMVTPPEQQVELGAPSAQVGERAEQVQEALQDYLASLSVLTEREQRNYDSSRIKNMARTLSGMARALSAVGGRKQVVLFSEGFDSRLLLGRGESEVAERRQDASDAVFSEDQWKVDSDQRYGNTELQTALARMLEEFRRADCVIQAVDVGGLRAGADQTPGRRGPGQDALFYMANETGGGLVRDANQLRPELDRMLRRTMVTYLLTFQRSDLVPDGAYHRLQVKAKLPAGARLAHRAGYYAPRPYAELPALERELLASDSISAGAPRHDLDVNVLAAAFRAGGGRAYVPVIVEVGGAGLLEGQTGNRIAVELYGYVSDEHGEMRDYFSQEVGFNARGDAFRQGGVKYYGHLDLGPGRYLVRVLVRNALTGRTGMQTQRLVVPEYSGPVLLPPFFVEPPGRWLMVRESSGQVQQQSVVYPFVVKGDPYVPEARPRLELGKQAPLCLVAYNLGSETPKMTAEVCDAAGKPLRGAKLAVERTATAISGYDHFAATFTPEGLQPGEYRLRVSVGDGANRATSEIPFEVVEPDPERR